MAMKVEIRDNKLFTEIDLEKPLLYTQCGISLPSGA